MSTDGAVRICNCVHRSARDIDDAVTVLYNGGLVLMPSDTTYIMATQLLRKNKSSNGISNGIERLHTSKNRHRSSAFPWLVASRHQLEVLGCELSEDALEIATKMWPQPITLVVRASAAVPQALARPDQTVAIRMTSHPLVAGIIHACGTPLIVSSANRHLHEVPKYFSQVDPRMIEAADIAFNGVPNLCHGPSTIIDCTEGETRVLRRGAVPLSQIEKVLGHRILS